MKDVEGLLSVMREAEAASYDQPLSPSADAQVRSAWASRPWPREAGWLAVLGAVTVAMLLLLQPGRTPRLRPVHSLSREDAGPLTLDLNFADASAAAAAAHAQEQRAGGPVLLP